MWYADTRYPVKSIWLKAIKAGNFVGWPILTKRNVNKYYLDTNKTPKGHMNQTRENVQSTKRAPLESFVSAEMKSKKVRDVYVKVYNARETMFLDRTGQFPTISKLLGFYGRFVVTREDSRGRNQCFFPVNIF